jgi:hypothetical protein
MKFYEIFRKRRRLRMEKENKNTRECQYPIGDPQHKNFKFCCAPVERDRFVYCDAHAELCYTNYNEIKDKPRRVKALGGK